MAVDELSLDRARALGAFAARRRLAVTSCPWKGDDPRARTLGFAWMNAYLHYRPPFNVDYSD
jgi:hypothetical protein